MSSTYAFTNQGKKVKKGNQIKQGNKRKHFSPQESQTLSIFSRKNHLDPTHTFVEKFTKRSKTFHGAENIIGSYSGNLEFPKNQSTGVGINIVQKV